MLKLRKGDLAAMTERDNDVIEVPENGPYIQIAAFCESVLIEQSGVTSLIRLVDRLTTPVGLLPEGTPPPPHLLTAVIALKAGLARGSVDITLRAEAPSGLRLPDMTVSVLLEGEDRGIALQVPVAIPTEVEGLYWFDVLVDDRLMTRIPLRVVHQRGRAMSQP